MNRASRALASWSLLVVLAGCASSPAGPLREAAAPGGPAAVARPAPEASTARSSEVPAAEPAVSSGPEAAPDAPDAGAGSDPVKVLEKGLASWYGQQFHGRRTASGERYDRHAMTAAHRTLPFGTRVRVRSVATGKEVVVRINDRGPFKRSRVIDLSEAAISAMGLRHRGVTQVELLPE